MKSKIDVSTQEGLDLLKERAKFYGYYAENLKVLELIKEVQNWRACNADSLCFSEWLLLNSKK